MTAAALSTSAPSTDFKRFGLRGRFFLAFGAIAAMTLVACAAAWVQFSRVGGLMGDVARRNIPEAIATLELASDTRGLAAVAPALLAAADPADRARQLAALAELQAAIGRRTGELEGFPEMAEPARRLRALTDRLNASLTDLAQAVDRRLDAAARRVAAGKAAGAAHTQLLAALTPALEQAQSTEMQSEIAMVSMVIRDPGEATKAATALVSDQMPLSQGLADMVASSNLLASLLGRAETAPDPAAVDGLAKEFDGLAGHLAETLDGVDKIQPAEGAKPALDALLAAGRGDGGLFALRRAELAADAAGRGLVQQTRAVTAELAAEVAQDVAAVQTATDDATGRFAAAVRLGTIVLAAIAAATLVGSLLFVSLYVGRNLLARLVAVQQAMTRIAAGDLGVAIRGAGHPDEIGGMARALEVFRDGLITARTLAADQAAEAQARQQRAQAIEALTRHFDQGASGALAAVADAAGAMDGTASTMVSVAGAARARTEAVEMAFGQAAANVETVAAATEELSASIAEISRQVAESATISDDAVRQVGLSQTTVAELTAAAGRIGDVVGLIRDVAGQTNLLAHNATLEAARAGSAGRGFAVVASEVKRLARQTAEATETIGDQVTAIQRASRQAVAAIGAIGQIVDRQSAIAAGVASAIQEQGAATGEIARNIQAASAGTRAVAAEITGMAGVAAACGQAADSVHHAAERLTREAGTLRAEVDGFLGRIQSV